MVWSGTVSGLVVYDLRWYLRIAKLLRVFFSICMQLRLRCRASTFAIVHFDNVLTRSGYGKHCTYHRITALYKLLGVVKGQVIAKCCRPPLISSHDSALECPYFSKSIRGSCGNYDSSLV